MNPMPECPRYASLDLEVMNVTREHSLELAVRCEEYGAVNGRDAGLLRMQSTEAR